MRCPKSENGRHVLDYRSLIYADVADNGAIFDGTCLECGCPGSLLLPFDEQDVQWDEDSLQSLAGPCPHGLDNLGCRGSCRHYEHGSEQFCADCEGL